MSGVQRSVYDNVMAGGGRVTRAGDLAVVYLQGCAFATTTQDFQQAQQWARSRTGQSTPQKDRAIFIARFEVIIGRSGSGIATKGSPKQLARMVKEMGQIGLTIEDWLIPKNVELEDIEIKKKQAEPEGEAPKPD